MLRHARAVTADSRGGLWILTRRSKNSGYAIEYLADFKAKKTCEIPYDGGAVRIVAANGLSTGTQS